MSKCEFWDANLTGAIFTDAIITGTSFFKTPKFTQEQLYSTKSWKIGDLRGISMDRNNISGWNFAGQNMQGVWIKGSNLTGADLTGANLQNAETLGATFADANLTSADLRGANGLSTDGAILKNTILADGTVANFSLESAEDKLIINSGSDVAVTLGEGTYYVRNGASIVFKVSESNARSLAFDFPAIGGGGDSTMLVFDNTSRIVLDFGEYSVADGSYRLIDSSSFGSVSGLADAAVVIVSNGEEIEAAFGTDENGSIVVSTVPEPAFFAAFAAAAALAFAARRKYAK